MLCYVVNNTMSTNSLVVVFFVCFVWATELQLYTGKGKYVPLCNLSMSRFSSMGGTCLCKIK